MNTGSDARFIVRSISEFIFTYVPSHLTESPNTIKAYKASINLYLDFLEDIKQYSLRTICRKCFERQMIEEWLRYLRDERKCLPKTCNDRLGLFRTFLKYLGTRDTEYKYLYLEAMEIPLMKAGKKKVNGLTKEAIKAIINEPDQHTIAGKRDLLFMMIAYGTAARMTEILSIKMKHLHLEGEKPYVSVVGKGNKVRSLYLLPKVVTYTKQYIKIVYGNTPDPERYLFNSRNGDGKGRLSSRAIEKRLHEYACKAHEKCADVPLDLHAHQFRHARATHWLEEGINILQISILLGHENLETTMKYLDIGTEDQIKALTTMDDENDKKTNKNWKQNKDSLKNILR